MAYLTANNYPVSRANITLPLSGRATAELMIAQSSSVAPIRVGDAVALQFQDGTSHAMTAVRAGADGGLWSISCVAGRNTLGKKLEPKFYRNVELRTMITDICRETGEALGDIALDVRYNAYMRMAGRGNQILGYMLEGLASWRFDSAGRLLIAPNDWTVTHEATAAVATGYAQMLRLLPLPALQAGEQVRVGEQVLRPTTVQQVLEVVAGVPTIGTVVYT